MSFSAVTKLCRTCLHNDKPYCTTGKSFPAAQGQGTFWTCRFLASFKLDCNKSTARTNDKGEWGPHASHVFYNGKLFQQSHLGEHMMCQNSKYSLATLTVCHQSPFGVTYPRLLDALSCQKPSQNSILVWWSPFLIYGRGIGIQKLMLNNFDYT